MSRCSLQPGQAKGDRSAKEGSAEFENQIPSSHPKTSFRAFRLDGGSPPPPKSLSSPVQKQLRGRASTAKHRQTNQSLYRLFRTASRAEGLDGKTLEHESAYVCAGCYLCLCLLLETP